MMEFNNADESFDVSFDETIQWPKGNSSDMMQIIKTDITNLQNNKADKTDVPTKTSQLENDSGFLTEHQDISGKQDKLTAGTNITIKNNVISASGGGGTSSTDTKTLYTFNDAYVNWCSGEVFPILICGDSTIAGYGTSDVSGKTKAWVKRLEEKLRYECNNEQITLYNLAVSGTTLPSIAQFDTWFGTSGQYNDCKMVGIGWGINDRLAPKNKKDYYASVYNKTKALVEKAFDLGIQPFLITTQATMESNVSQSYAASYPLRNAENINICANNAKRDLAKEYNLEIIDLNILTEKYLKHSNVPINQIIPDRLHFNDLGNLFEAGAVFMNMVNRTIVINRKDQKNINYADQHVTNGVRENYLSYGGDLKVYASYTKDNDSDIKIFDTYVYIKDFPATLEAYKTRVDSSTYVVIDGELTEAEGKTTISLSELQNGLPELDIGLHHLEVYTGNSALVDFAGFVINKPIEGGQIVSLQSIAFVSSTYSASVGEQIQTRLVYTPANATNKNVTYSSTGGTIDSNGIFIADTAGTYTITATSQEGNYTSTCTIEIASAIYVEGISLSQTTANMVKGDLLHLSATVIPSNATDKLVTWSVDNDLCSVNNGLVTCISDEPGTSVITVTTNDGGYTATCVITVVEILLFDNTSENGGSYGTSTYADGVKPAGLFFEYDVANKKTALSGKTITAFATKVSGANENSTLTFGKMVCDDRAVVRDEIPDLITVAPSSISADGVCKYDLGEIILGENETLTIGKSGDGGSTYYFIEASTETQNRKNRIAARNGTPSASKLAMLCKIWGYDNQSL